MENVIVVISRLLPADAVEYYRFVVSKFFILLNCLINVFSTYFSCPLFHDFLDG